MNFLIPIFSLLFIDGFVSKNTAKSSYKVQEYTKKYQTLELNYIIWGCECPNWIRKEDFIEYSDNKLIEHCFYIEAQDKKYDYFENFDPEKNRLKVTGYFEKEKRIPDELLNSEETVRPSNIFVFVKYEIIEVK